MLSLPYLCISTFSAKVVWKSMGFRQRHAEFLGSFDGVPVHKKRRTSCIPNWAITKRYLTKMLIDGKYVHFKLDRSCPRMKPPWLGNNEAVRLRGR